jgi:glycosyltransferase involved in cell wall biosynthesis
MTAAEEERNLLVVVPAFNEEVVIRNTLKTLKALPDIPGWAINIVVVNDGSFDKTAREAHRGGVPVISHPFNCGVGIALRTGFRWAQIHKYDAVIQVDADGQHPVEDIHLLLRTLASSNADIVLGSRFLAGAWDTSWIRRITMHALAKLVSMGTGSKITDSTSGFRVSGKRAIELFANEYPGEYLGDTVESLILGHQRGLTIVEIPAALKQRQGGEASHLSVRSSLHVLRVFVMVALRLSKPKNESR